METFGPRQAQQLTEYLNGVERNTTICPITSPEELMYGRSGRTQRGEYRLTALSFRQLCKILAHGLSTLLPELAGVVARADIDDELTDFRRAREIFNGIVTLRFPLLRQYRLLRNEQAKLIDGVVGQKHRSLDNATMFERVNEAVQETASGVVFHTAVVTGRKMTVWYRHPEPLFVVDVDGQPWSFHRGYYFRNAESTGTSVCGSLTIFTRQGTCMMPFTKQGRVMHIGRDFQQRLSKMFQHVLATTVDAQQLQAGVERLLTTPLGYAELGDKARRAFEKEIVHNLSALGLPQRWAAECFENALTVGRADPRQLSPARSPRQVLATRTYFDVLCPLLRMARSLPSNRRESVEQVAYRMLTGKLATRI